jgi:hypothetical protein
MGPVRCHGPRAKRWLTLHRAAASVLRWGSILTVGVLVGGVSPCGAAFAEEAVDEEPEVITVYGDRFARWDGTRWFAEVQVGLPMPLRWVLGEYDTEADVQIRVEAIHLKSVIACEKTWRQGKHGFEVDCVVEDAAVRGVTFIDLKKEKYREDAERIFDRLDELVTGRKLQLKVRDDGRVTGVDLDGLPENTRREKAMAEITRQFFLRLMSGFTMKLPAGNLLKAGMQWQEYNSPVFAVPGYEPSRGGSTLTHQLNPYRGRLVVQTLGAATVATGDEDGGYTGEDFENTYKVEYSGVALYDRDTGIMTERVWALQGRATASSQLADGWKGTLYFQIGRLDQIEEGETPPDLGPSGRASRPGLPVPGLIPWETIDP